MKRSVSLLVCGVLPAFAVLFNIQPMARGECVEAPYGLVAWWPGDGNANDIQDGNNGTLGNVRFATGEVDQGFIFICDEQGVVIAHNSTLNVNSPGFTADFWMQGIKNQPESPAAVFEKSHGFVDFTGWAFQINSSTGAMGFALGDGSGFPEVTSTVDVLDGNFHHVAGTWDGSFIRLYVDGVLQGSAANSSPANNTRDLNIGFAWGGGSPRRFFKGIADELDVFNRALSESEIQSIYNAGSAGKCKPGPTPPEPSPTPTPTPTATATATATPTATATATFTPTPTPQPSPTPTPTPTSTPTATPTPACAAQVQPPINADGSSVFTVRRGVVPVKFNLTCNGNPSCDLPPATIAVTRTDGGVIGEVNESVYSMSADTGSNFRIDSCQYIYNLNSSALGVGTYRVDILINGQVVGSGTFKLK